MGAGIAKRMALRLTETTLKRHFFLILQLVLSSTSLSLTSESSFPHYVPHYATAPHPINKLLRHWKSWCAQCAAASPSPLELESSDVRYVYFLCSFLRVWCKRGGDVHLSSVYLLTAALHYLPVQRASAVSRCTIGKFDAYYILLLHIL